MTTPISFRPMQFRAAPMLVSVEGPSGSGKTLSGLLLAAGMAGCPSKLFVIDAERGRATHFIGRFGDKVPMYYELEPPYRPSRYLAAIKAAVDAGAKAVLVDTGSHEHEGEGGILDWWGQILHRMAGDDPGKQERCKMAAWIEPKADRRKLLVGALVPPIVNQVWAFRAKAKLVIDDTKRGKDRISTEIDAIGGLSYEMTCRFQLRDGDEAGKLWPVKMPEGMSGLITPGEYATQDVGARLASWAPKRADPSPAKPAATLALPGGATLPVAAGCLDQWVAGWRDALAADAAVCMADFSGAAAGARIIYAKSAPAIEKIANLEAYAKEFLA